MLLDDTLEPDVDLPPQKKIHIEAMHSLRIIFIVCTCICNPQRQLSTLIGYIRAQQTLSACCTKSQSGCEGLHSTLIVALHIAAKLQYTFRTCTRSPSHNHLTLSKLDIQADFYLFHTCTYLIVLHVALCK